MSQASNQNYEQQADTTSNLKIGMNGRFFQSNWRPAIEEIAFAHQSGFSSIQFQGYEGGLQPEDLAASFEEVKAALVQASLSPVMEIVVRVGEDAKTQAGKTPLEVLEANLPALSAMGFIRAHIHLAPAIMMDDATMRRIEEKVLPQFEKAVSYGQSEGFIFGFEHNEPRLRLFASPEHCLPALEAVPDLGFVWDINHTTTEHLPAYQALIPRMTMLHVSDTPLPEVNHHVPLGQGNIDYVGICKALKEGGFNGPAILEIGGLPKSGGYGKDTDEALVESLKILSDINTKIKA